MLWLAAEEREAEYVCQLLEKEGTTGNIRFAPRRGLLPPRWIVTGRIDDPGRERRVRQRLDGLLPREWR